MTKILTNIEKLAGRIADHALLANTSLQDQMEALKLLTPYYTVLKKSKGRSDDESSDGPTMGDMQRRLRVIEGDAGDDDGAVETAAGGGGRSLPGRAAQDPGN